MRHVSPRGRWIRQALMALIVAILFLALVPAQAGAGSWGYYRTLTIDRTKVPSDQTNFPVLISITDSTLAHTGSGGHMGKTNAGDLRFTDNSNTTAYDYEIESYNSGTGALVAWVKVPTVSSSSDTIVRMWYGNASASDGANATGVWDSNFVMVQHMEETSGTLADSTSNSNNGTATNGVTQDATGQMDGADSFDGLNDYLNFGSASRMNPTGHLTVETCAKAMN